MIFTALCVGLLIWILGAALIVWQCRERGDE